ncbi:MAG TPA: HIT family protein [Bacilli bacterium]|nr:HIT family protein [Bacilli bacterium]
MNDCPFCHPEQDPEQQVVFENEFVRFLQRPQQILIGSGLIVPKAHRVTVFDLTAEEWIATQHLLRQVKAHLDEQFHPQGYNVGWNVGQIGGQEIFHAHLHLIPRYADEPYAGRGIRSWIKREENRRPAQPSQQKERV